jgi:diguanylate cyclase (GGDEF)-like protein
LVFLAGNILLCAVRLTAALLAVRARPGERIWATDFYVLVTLVWCGLEGALTGAAVFSSFSAMQVLGSAAALAPQGVLAARNFSAPRFAMAIILCLDLPYVAGATFSPDHWLIVVTLFTPGYLIATFTAVKHFQKLSIENYVARFASRQEARRDPLTGVLNRLGMAEALERARGAADSLTLFMMDLDGFKMVNDTHGHAAGDVLLQMVTARLHEVARKQDSVARLGGDEFALIAPGLGAVAAAGMAARIVAAVSVADYRLCDGVTARVGVSVGYACAPEDGCTLQGLSELADAALYAVKQRGKGSWQRAELLQSPN